MIMIGTIGIIDIIGVVLLVRKFLSFSLLFAISIIIIIISTIIISSSIISIIIIIVMVLILR